MKGISTTLVIIVTAIVILVAALVVLTIFGEGIGVVGDWASKQSICMSEYSTVCATTGSEPATWNARAKVTILAGQYKLCSCADLVRNCNCGTDRVAKGCTPVPIEQAGCIDA